MVFQPFTPAGPVGGASIRIVKTAEMLGLRPVGLSDVSESFLDTMHINCRVTKKENIGSMSGARRRNAFPTIDAAFVAKQWILQTFLLDYNRMPAEYGIQTFTSFTSFICCLLDGTFPWVDTANLRIELPIIQGFDWEHYADISKSGSASGSGYGFGYGFGYVDDDSVVQTALRHGFHVSRIENHDASLAQYDLSAEGRETLPQYLDGNPFVDNNRLCRGFLLIKK